MQFRFATHLLCSAPVHTGPSRVVPWPEDLMDGGAYVSEARSWKRHPPPAVQMAAAEAAEYGGSLRDGEGRLPVPGGN